MTPTLRVLFITAEANPFVKVGGLGDVGGALPKALARRGHDVRLVIPCYPSVDKARCGFKETQRSVAVAQGTMRYTAGVWQATMPEGFTAYLLENQEFFHRASIYGEKDDLDRFLFLSRAALSLPEVIGWQPQVVHCNDWHTSFIPAILHQDYQAVRAYRETASLLTVHNLAYQGWFDYRWAAAAEVARYIPGPENPLHPRLWRALALGIYYADVINTVSETYAREILTPELGEGLDPVLQQRQGELLGIINGLDYEQFDPAKDPHIPQRYDIHSQDGKQANKQALQKRMGLAQDPSVPLVGNVGRLTTQKGPQIMLEAIERLLRQGHQLQFVLEGTGETAFENAARDLAGRYSQNVVVVIDFDPALAQLIYSGCDIFFMPSLFEPCGLGQLIAMRYGTIPVARRTGGLADTVKDGVTGFLFDSFSAEEAAWALRVALEAWRNRSRWEQLMVNAFSQDFSWDAAAVKYEEAYRFAMSVHSEGRCRKSL